MFEIPPLGPYSLKSSRRFLEEFTPAAYEGAGDPNHLHLAFAVDNTEQVAGVCVRSNKDAVIGEVFGDALEEAVRRQVERILSLNIDGRRFPEVGKRDPVVGGLQARYPGLRPVCFYSPYEAAAWALISHRIRITQASRIKAAIAEQLGDAIDIHGEKLWAFPAPSRLALLEGFPGLFGRKVEYLRQLGEVAAQGGLDAVYLRSLPVGNALMRLKELPGIGDFSAQLILLRGAGEPDYVPEHESRLRQAVAVAYGLNHLPTTEEIRKVSNNWKPYRTWVSLLLRVMLEEDTSDIRS